VAGFVDVSITPTHEAAPGMVSAIVKATRGPEVIADEGRRTMLPMVQERCC